MSLLIRTLLYAVSLFLVMLVYTAQKNTTAEATVAAAARSTARLMAWTVVAVVVMFGLEFVFID